MIPFEEEMKNMFLAGIGAVATTAEKAQDMIEKMVSKGKLTVEQGKVLNEELKRDFKEVKNDVGQKSGDILNKIQDLSDKELDVILDKINQIKNANKK